MIMPDADKQDGEEKRRKRLPTSDPKKVVRGLKLKESKRRKGGEDLNRQSDLPENLN